MLQLDAQTVFIIFNFVYLFLYTFFGWGGGVGWLSGKLLLILKRDNFVPSLIFFAGLISGLGCNSQSRRLNIELLIDQSSPSSILRRLLSGNPPYIHGLHHHNITNTIFKCIMFSFFYHSISIGCL